MKRQVAHRNKSFPKDQSFAPLRHLIYACLPQYDIINRFGIQSFSRDDKQGKSDGNVSVRFRSTITAGR